MVSREAYDSDAATLVTDSSSATYSCFSSDQITIHFLAQVGNVQSQTPLAQQRDHTPQATQAAKMAQVVADFISKARKTVHIAIYDFLLTGRAEALMLDAINQAAQAGISVQIAYNKPTKEKTPAERGATGADAAPVDNNNRLSEKGYLHQSVQLKAVEEMDEKRFNNDTVGEIEPPAQVEDIEHPSNIMHSKYIIRDGEAVLMGSANFTDGAWGLQENNVVVFEEAKSLADFYEADFNGLWTTDSIKGTGESNSGQAQVGTTRVSVAFAPHDGEVVTDDIVKAMSGAKRRLLVASMVISSQKILEAIHSSNARIPGGVKVLIDQTEMNNAVLSHWRRSANPASAEKLRFWETVSRGFQGKKSEVYVNGQPNWPHNFMHNKFAVADDIVVTGSFNFSQNAEKNAENIVVIQDENLADAYTAYFDQIYQRYLSSH